MLGHREHQWEAVWTTTRFWTFSSQAFLMSQWAESESEFVRTLDLGRFQERLKTHYRASCVSLPHLSSVWANNPDDLWRSPNKRRAGQCLQILLPLWWRVPEFTKKTANTETLCVSSFVDSVSPLPLSMGSSSLLWTDTEGEDGL